MSEIYRLSARVTISLFTDVKADSPAQALEIARGRGMCRLMDPERLGQESTEVWFHSGEIDGTPQNIQIDEIL